MAQGLGFSSPFFSGGGQQGYSPEQYVSIYNQLMASPYGQQIIASNAEASGYQREELGIKQKALDLEYQQMIRLGVPKMEADRAYQQATMQLQQRGQQLDEQYRRDQLAQTGQLTREEIGLRRELGQGDLGLRQQQLTQQGDQFRVNTGMGLATLASQLSGPENWGRFSDAMRGNAISGEVPGFFSALQNNQLTGTGTIAPAGENLPGALNLQSLMGNASQQAMQGAPQGMAGMPPAPGQAPGGGPFLGAPGAAPGGLAQAYGAPAAFNEGGGDGLMYHAMQAPGGQAPATGVATDRIPVQQQQTGFFGPQRMQAQPMHQMGMMQPMHQANNMQQTDQMVRGLAARGGGSLAPGQLENLDENEQKMLASRMNATGGDAGQFFRKYKSSRPPGASGGFSYAA